MLKEKLIIDQIEVTQGNHIQVRKYLIIERDGIEISKTISRVAYYPGQDISHEDPKVITIANTVWTKEVIQKFQEHIKQQEMMLTNNNIV